MLGTQFWNQNGIKQLSKNEPPGIQMAPKINYGGLTGGQAEEETFLKPSGTPPGPHLGSHVGIQNRSKPITEALPKRK